MKRSLSSSQSLTARAAERRLKRAASPARARLLQRFFKTGPGEYGEGDQFLGLTLPEIRALASEFRAMTLAEADVLLRSRWHEARLLALIILANAYRHADVRRRRQIYELYLRRTPRINNWDLVDVTASHIVGTHLLSRPRAVLRRLARSPSLWERRIAIIATGAFITRGEFRDTLELATMLLHDRHDLIHKAVGWMLREVGKRDERALRRFLDQHAASMPRTMLRYAIERLPRSVRLAYMSAPRAVQSRRRAATAVASRRGSSKGRPR